MIDKKLKTDLNFHQTFPPSMNQIARLFDICDTGTAYSKEEISAMTGIPTGKSSGKVEPMIKYAEYMGLITDEYSEKKHLLHTTKLGREIQMQDIGFYEKITLLLCHIRLTSITGACLWNFAFKKLIPAQTKGLDTLSFNATASRYLEVSNLNLSPFYSCYKDVFSALEICGFDKNNTLNLNNTYLCKEFLYAYAYALLYEWEQTYTDNQITSHELYAMNIHTTLGLSEIRFDELLNELQNINIIKLNRVLSPFSITKLTLSENVIENLYSLLL